MTLKEIESYLQKKNEYFSAEIGKELETKRQEAIQEQDEERANHLWCLSLIYYVQSSFVSMFNMIRSRNYAKAYQAMKQTELQLTILVQNYDIEHQIEDPYQLSLIRSLLEEYHKLFPYEYFLCREMLIKQEKCSICGEVVKLRGGCGHIPGKVYMGEVCVHEPSDFKFFDMKVTIDPFYKYDVLEPYQSEKLQYNYGMLEGLMQSIKSPYEYWEVEVVKEKNPQFANIGRNDRCPCGSGKKFKQCCMNKEDVMYFDHYKIRLLNEKDEKFIARPLKML